jgi:hypothetical protein
VSEQPPDRPRLRDLLEFQALHPSIPAAERDSAWDIEIEASKAISLKRIADALGAESQFLWALRGTFDDINHNHAQRMGK